MLQISWKFGRANVQNTTSETELAEVQTADKHDPKVILNVCSPLKIRKKIL